MAEVVSNLPVRLDSRPGDERLTPDELKVLGVFKRLSKVPGFERLPGSCVLRKYDVDDPICIQGAPGATAFYIITSEDLYNLRTVQLEMIEKALAAIDGSLDVSMGSQDSEVSDSGSGVRRRISRKALGRYRTYGEMQLLAEKDRIEDEIGIHDARTQATLSGDIEPVVRAYIVAANTERIRRRGVLGWVRGLFSTASRRKKPRTISNQDLPVELDGTTFQADMHEGEIFGEMSCLNRLPRAATVIATRDCYVLEFSRNVLDLMRKDNDFRRHLDDQYRHRVLKNHVRRLPIFADISDETFARLSESIELVEYEAGQVIFEEGERSGDFYIVRSGWVKIAVNVWSLLTDAESQSCDWPALAREIAVPAADGVRKWVVDTFDAAVRDAASRVAAGTDPAAAPQLRDALNAWITGGQTKKALGSLSKTAAAVALIGGESATIGMESFPEKTGEWTEFQTRQFHRVALEAAFPGLIPRKLERGGAPRVLRYSGRGDFFGEMGLILKTPRSATCIALAQPDLGQSKAGGAGLVGSRTELVRLRREHFEELLAGDDRLKNRIRDVVAQRVTSDTERKQPGSSVPPADELGLAQGQKLMLVDLDRCTRCGACMEACVQTHDDGWNRLYLDGPRYGRFLVPMTCRQCRDPVCMIGCPVGAINKGDADEIQITDWCIGCTQCADQCPYGAIQMNELEEPAKPPKELLPLMASTEVKKVTHKAVVCDQCHTLPGGVGPACVVACPHDAAFRLDGLQFLARPALASLPPSLTVAATKGPA